MPEYLPDIGSTSIEVQKLLADENSLCNDPNNSKELTVWNVKDLTERFPDITIMGFGTESVVLGNPDNLDQVVSLGFDSRRRKGVLPFAETYNIHKMLSCLYPDDFAKVFSVSGIDIRNAVKEKITGREFRNSFEARSTIDKFIAIEAELKAAGISIDIDTSDSNFIKDQLGAKYIDFAQTGVVDNTKIDTNKITEIFERNNWSLSPDKKRSQLKQLLSSVERLRELGVVNQIFDDMTEKNDYVIDYQKVLNELGPGAEDKTLHRVRLLLSKAIDAVKNKGYKYKNNKWVV